MGWQDAPVAEAKPAWASAPVAVHATADTAADEIATRITDKMSGKTPGALTDEEQAFAKKIESGLSPGIALRAMGAGATRVLTGPLRLNEALRESLGIPGASVKDYNKEVAKLETGIAGVPVGPKTAEGALAKTGELVAQTAVPMGAASRATTLTGAVARGVGTGALTGALLGSDSNEATPAEVAKGAATRAAVGAAIGGTISTIGGIWPAAKNAVKGLMDLNQPVGKTAENIAAKNTTAPFRAIPMTPAEQTGSPALAAYQAKLVGKESLAFQNKQLDQYGKALDEITSTMKGSPDPKGAAIKLSEAVGRTSANLQRAASKEYGDGLQAVRAAAAKAPDAFQVPFDRFQQALQDAQAVGGKSWKTMLTGKRGDNPVLDDAIDTLLQARNLGVNKLTVDDIIEIKAAANTLRSGLQKTDMNATEMARNRLGKSIANAVDDDVDTFLNSQAGAPPSPTRDALRLLDETNARYKARLAQAADHRAAFASQIFGGQVPADAGEAFNMLLKMPESEQVRALNTMRNLDPGIIDDIKTWKMNDVSQKIQDQARAGNMSVFDPKAAVNELTNGSKIIGARFWTPVELAKIKSAVGSARTLMTAMPGGRPLAGTEAIDIGRTAGAGITMSPPFVLMQVNRLFAKGKMANLFFTEEGQRALNTVSQTYTKPTAETAKALTILTNMAGSSDQQPAE